jgi:heme/copper-type cytochrome/quinol oxidase subunit 2
VDKERAMDRLILVIAVNTLLPPTVFWALMFSDLSRNDDMPGAVKQYWTMAFVFLNVFAALWYYFVAYRHRD